MRYVNLKKRNTSKFQYVSKRMATASIFCLALTAVIVVPLTSNSKNNVEAINEYGIVDIANDYMYEQEVDVQCYDELQEIE